MEVGYVPDLREGGFSQQVWCPGEPRKSFWTGLKIGADKLVSVKTLRCPRCGYLESYAIPQSQNGVLVSGRSSRQRQLAAVLIGLVVLLIAFGIVFLIRAR